MLALFVFLVAIIWLAKVAIAGLRNPLSHLPGPWYSRFTHYVLKYHITAGDRIYYVEALHKRYGPIVRIAPGEVAVADNEAFGQIHKIGSGFLKSDWYDSATGPEEAGLFAERDPHRHAVRRKLFSQPLSNSALQRNWEPQIRAKIALAVSKIREDATAGTADLLKWWTLMASDVIAHLSFGESFHMIEQGKQTSYITAIQLVAVDMIVRYELPWLYPLLRYVPIQVVRDMTNAKSVVNEQGGIAIANMRRGADGTANKKQNLFGQMLAMSSDDDDDDDAQTMIKSGEIISEAGIRREAANLIVAGSDTSAITLTYLVWAVLKRPALQRALEEEVAALSAALDMRELTQQAPLLNSVIQETLRMYGTVAGALPREVPEKGATLCGLDIPGGTTVSTHVYITQRDHKVFENADTFDGYRFYDPQAITPAQKTAMAAFGAGSRICIGIHLVMMEFRLATALFFRECRGVRLSAEMTDDMMHMEERFFASPKGHTMKVTFGGDEGWVGNELSDLEKEPLV